MPGIAFFARVGTAYGRTTTMKASTCTTSRLNARSGLISPRHACGREHEIRDQAHNRHGAKKTVVNCATCSGKRASIPARPNRPEQDVLYPSFSIIRKKREDHRSIKNCERRQKPSKAPPDEPSLGTGSLSGSSGLRSFGISEPCFRSQTSYCRMLPASRARDDGPITTSNDRRNPRPFAKFLSILSV